MKTYKTIKALAGWVLLPAGLVLAAGVLTGCGDDYHRVNYARHGGYYPAPVVVHQPPPPPMAVYRQPGPVYRAPGAVYRAPVMAPSHVPSPRHGPPDRGGPRHR